MRLKFEHLLRPRRSVKLARERLSAQLNMRRFAKVGERRFHNDARFDLSLVSDEFADRFSDETADEALLERICTAYAKAEEAQRRASGIFRATDWWEQLRRSSLQPAISALRAGDRSLLCGMYRNFFRDPCSTGLIGMPYGLPKSPFQGTISDLHRRVFLTDALYRLDYWGMQTGGRFAVRDLAGPGIGNPFGMFVGGILIESGAEYRHYCADRINLLLGPGRKVMTEVGGGFGGMAYYLLRDRKDVTWVDFDVPESIALASWYLMKAFPDLRFLLYGEEDLTQDAIARADVVLMPVSEMETMPSKCADLCFSSHAISDVSADVLETYLEEIRRTTRDSFLFVGNSRAGESICDLVSRGGRSLTLAGKGASAWNSHKVPGVLESECLFHVNQA
ncbi:MAG TPA: putative sugar O-methyltransferase [Bryobacteraceae bacterium]|jgi:hypothetical protein|nr:putative sugar O-methyltransferase [Bryobacteraceae bacterium]